MYPNVYGYGTSLDVTPLDDYYILFSKRADIGYDKLRNKLNKNLSLQKLEIVFAKPRIYGKLEGFKPRIIIKNKQGSFDIEEIKMVFKVGNLYKVGVVAPWFL